MLHTFVSSQVARWSAARLGVASFSVLAHASLITIAVVESGRATSAFIPGGKTVPVENLRFVDVRELTTRKLAAREGALAHVTKHVMRLFVPDLKKLQVVVNTSLAAVVPAPEIPLDFEVKARTADASDFGEVDTKELFRTTAQWALAHPGPDNAYSAEIVERMAWPRNDNPHPRYPEALKDAGVEGTLLAQFVVDSTGRVDAKTLTFPKPAHPMFLRAVRDALLRSRYFPAELAGVRVRQLVQQQFTFVIAR